MLLFIIVVASILFYLIKQTKDFKKIFYKSSFFIWILTPLLFMFYGKRPSEYYYIYLYPFLIILISDFLLIIKNKIFLYIPIFFVVLIFLNTIIYSNSDNKILQVDNLALFYKDKTVKKITDIVDLSKKFNVSIDAPPGLNNGFKYFIDWYGIKNNGNWKNDYLVEIRNPLRIGDIKINDAIGLKIPKEILK